MLSCVRNRRPRMPLNYFGIRPSTSIAVAKPVQRKPLQPHAFASFDISFIGSGGSNPSRFRGMPCMTLILGGDLWMFDAGEGTVRQTTFARSCVDVKKIFISNMHADRIFGLAGVILLTDTRYSSNLEKYEPLNIYGPAGLHKFLCTTLHLSHNIIKRKIIVHELALSSTDVLHISDKRGVGPWQKPLSAYVGDKSSEPMEGCHNILRRDVYSEDGVWNLVDESRITVTSRLVSHRIPSFAFVIKETDKGGPVLDEACRKRSVDHKYFLDLKEGKDVTLDDGTIVRAADVIGPSIKGRKMVYLGDTRDASNVVEMARDCDLLVHEVTGPEPRKDLPKRKDIALPVVAAEMALQCGAKKLILNHIGCQFLPTKINTVKNKHTDIRWDSELLLEAQNTLGRPNDVLVARDFITVKLPIGGYSAADLNTPFNLDSPPYYTGRLYDPMTGLQIRNHSRHSEHSHTAAHASHAARYKDSANVEVAQVNSVEIISRIVQNAVTNAEVVELKPVNVVVEPLKEVKLEIVEERKIENVMEIKRDIIRLIEKPPNMIKSIPQQFAKKGRKIFGPVVIESRNEDGVLCIRKQQHRYNEDSMDMWDFDFNSGQGKHENDFVRMSPPLIKKPLHRK